MTATPLGARAHGDGGGDGVGGGVDDADGVRGVVGHVGEAGVGELVGRRGGRGAARGGHRHVEDTHVPGRRGGGDGGGGRNSVAGGASRAEGDGGGSDEVGAGDGDHQPPAVVPVVGAMAVIVGGLAAAAGVAARVRTGITNEQAMAMEMPIEVMRVDSRLTGASVSRNGWRCHALPPSASDALGGRRDPVAHRIADKERVCHAGRSTVWWVWSRWHISSEGLDRRDAQVSPGVNFRDSAGDLNADRERVVSRDS